MPSPSAMPCCWSAAGSTKRCTARRSSSSSASPAFTSRPMRTTTRSMSMRPAARRRSVYRFVFRTRPDPLLEALDCPDASQSAPVRSASVGALQALALWNNKFTLRHAEHLAELAAKAVGRSR